MYLFILLNSSFLKKDNYVLLITHSRAYFLQLIKGKTHYLGVRSIS